ncbi:MAG TPA: TldD/PmbA family protein [Methanomassiliicoccales archaeon]|nr:TldD/PmbA family protein [Methanomassiliicoccales archaeon]
MMDELELAVERMRAEGADFCDARYQTITTNGIAVVDAAVRRISEDRIRGVCLRARKKGSWGYATTVDSSKDIVLEAAVKAARNALAGNALGKIIPDTGEAKVELKANVRFHPSQVPMEEKVQAVLDMDRAQKIDPRIVNTNSVLREELRQNALVNSHGRQLSWEEVRTTIMVQAVASEAGRTEFFYDIKGGCLGFEVVKETDLETFGREVGKESLKMLAAEKAPSGLLTCITDPSISGLLAHEVMGHASEADEVVKRRSFLTDMVGKQVGSPLMTMVDDGTVPEARGSIPFDDEGTPSSRTTMIKDGVYQGYMQSLETAAEMGVRPTGNGRAQSYDRRVWVRMTNTFFEKGDQNLDEMIADVKYGVLTDRMISGMEDPVGGGFEAKALRGHLIENGRVTKLLRSFTLTGNALEILRTGDAVGNKVELDGGSCGKGIEDWVPVSSGGPHCRFKIVLGGD